MRYGAVEDAAVLRILRLKWCLENREECSFLASDFSPWPLFFTASVTFLLSLSIMKATIWKRGEHDWCSISSSLVHTGFFSNKLEKSLCSAVSGSSQAGYSSVGTESRRGHLSVTTTQALQELSVLHPVHSSQFATFPVVTSSANRQRLASEYGS